MKIVAISDLHGTLPANIVEPCDLLIVAGDICPDRFEGDWARHRPDKQLDWFRRKFLAWAHAQPAEKVVCTWGNHDFCAFPDAWTDGKVYVVVDQGLEVNGLKLWLTPWSNQFFNWAWMKPHEELAAVYDKIPEGLDILVSHQPPYGCGDIYPDVLSGKMGHIASSELLHAIEVKKPRVVICGHLHGGHGTYQLGSTTVFNVSILNEAYKHAYPSTVFALSPAGLVIPGFDGSPDPESDQSDEGGVHPECGARCAGGDSLGGDELRVSDSEAGGPDRGSPDAESR